MKKIAVLYFLLIQFSIFGRDQDKTILIPKEQPVVFMSLPKTNKLYLGIENQIIILVQNNTSKNVEVKTSNGTIQYLGYKKYIIKPETNGKAEITVLLDGNEISTEIYQVDYLPDPIARINNFWSSDTIPLKTLNNAAGITMVINSFNYEVQCVAQNYELVIIHKDGTSENILNNGAAFTSTTKLMLSKIKQGDWLIIKNIRFKYIGEDILRKNSMTLTYFVN